MNHKKTAMTVTTILCAMLFIVIGSCFSAFVYKDQIIKVNDPKLLVIEGISVFNEKGDKNIDKIELSQMKLGLKPATGEEDVETSIPSSITDKQGSEGHYAKFKVYAPSGASVYITNIKLETKGDQSKVQEERKNIFVAIKELGKSVSLEKDKTKLGDFEASDERVTYTFLVWLSAKSSDELKGTNISFDLSIEALAS